MKYYVRINVEDLLLKVDNYDFYKDQQSYLLKIGDVLVIDSSFGNKIGLKNYFKVVKIISESKSIAVESDIYLDKGHYGQVSIANLVETGEATDITKMIERDEKLITLGI